MDPLDKNVGVFDFSKSKNPIMDAFEMAASSLAVHKQVPNAKFYQIPTEPSKPPQNANVNPPKQASNSVPIPKPTSSSTQIQSPINELPVPSNVTIYPPPIADESDPDRIRLLHSWYWAGYYTGLSDGKRLSSSPRPTTTDSS